MNLAVRENPSDADKENGAVSSYDFPLPFLRRQLREFRQASVADMPYEMMLMMMPHSLPTRYEALDESLEALLNNGWSITQASGAGAGIALVLKRGQQHAICVLLGNMRDKQTGRSDCRRIN